MDYVLLIMGLILLGLTWLVVPTWAETPGTDQSSAPRSSLRRRFSSPLWSLIGSFLVLVALGASFFLFDRFPITLNLLKLILLNRYGLLIGALLIGLIPLALRVVPGLLRGVFVLRPWQLFNVTWMCVLVAAMVMLTTRVAEHNAGARYLIALVNAKSPPVTGVAADAKDWGLLRFILLFVLGLPIPYACLRCSLATSKKCSPLAFWAGLGGGALMALVLLFLTAVSQEVLLASSAKLNGLFPFQDWLAKQDLPQTPVLYGVGGVFAKLFQHLGDGYATTQDGELVLARGHAQALFGLGVVLTVYLLSYAWVLWFRLVPNRDFWFPPLFFVLLVLFLVGITLQGLAFWLDYYRIPVSLAVLGVTALLYAVNRTDHFFNLDPKPDLQPKEAVASARDSRAAADSSHRPPTLAEVAEAWHLPLVSPSPQQPAKRTLVVVTAAGGGIQASAWTARVLVGLHELYGEDFTRSIGLISAVSGGSVGTMYYLDQWNDRGPTFSPAALGSDDQGRPQPGSIRWNAQASSLEATVWGLAYPDLLQTFFPPLVQKTDDRGARIEEAWRQRMAHPDARLTEWSDRVRAGAMPVAIFNATVVETGQRLLAAPILACRPGDPPPNSTQARELLDLYPTARPRVATAVRLSATFPYVSPICRPLERPADDPQTDYHFADGGYVDNEGMMTVIEWLRRLLNPDYLLPAARRQRFDQVLLIRIKPFPTEDKAAPARSHGGWLYTTVGPIEALQNVRVASQSERNDLAVGVFTDAAKQQGVTIQSASFVFRPVREHGPVPLSWMLTERQKQNIDDAWNDLAKAPPREDPLAAVDQFFRYA